MWRSIVGRGFVLAMVLFVIEGFLQTQILGILAVLCILPLAVSILGAFVFQIVTTFR